jgi:hypothetical protein
MPSEFFLHFHDVNRNAGILECRRKVRRHRQSGIGIPTVRKGHAKTFSTELIQILILKIPKVSNILRSS